MGWKTHNTYAIANTLAGSGISREARPVPAIQPALLTVPAAWPPAAGTRPARAPARPCEPFFVSHPRRACSTNFNLILAYSEWLGTSSPVRNPFEWCDNRAVYDFLMSYSSPVHDDAFREKSSEFCFYSVENWVSSFLILIKASWSKYLHDTKSLSKEFFEVGSYKTYLYDAFLVFTCN